MFKRVFLVPAVMSVVMMGSMARAQQGDDQRPPIVQRCISQLQEITESTVGAINMLALNGVQRLNALDGNDAPVPVLLGSAAQSRAAIDHAREQGVTKVNRVTVHCLDVLEKHDAPAPFRQIVLEARRTATGAIVFASFTGKDAVGHALRRALEDEDAVPGSDGA